MRTRGFTLVETVLAMVILSTALVLLANSWGGAFSRVKKTQLNFEVAALLERKMTELQIEYRGKPLDSIPEDRAEDFGSEYAQYTWKMKSKELELPDLTPLMGGTEGVDQMVQQFIKQFADNLQKSIKEVRLTVIYKAPNGKNLEFSITSYFVDYDKNLSFAGGGMPAQ